MSIKATFPEGVELLTVHGLHQWDYGRRLEVSAPDLPQLVEVHFACAGARDAVVRLASVADGVASVIIPDTCLEQTAPVTAWVYEVGADYGHTALTVILPVTPRAKPTAATLPVAVGDKYAELVGLVNDYAAQMADGSIKVKSAETADLATFATSAASATAAGTANVAVSATMDSASNNIAATYGNFARAWVTSSPTARVNLPGEGIYLFVSGDRRCNCVSYWDGSSATDVLYDAEPGPGLRHVVRIYTTGEVNIGSMDATETFNEHTSTYIKFKALWVAPGVAVTAETEEGEV